MMLEDLSSFDVFECVKSSVPEIADHILDKLNKNVGFTDNPQALHPLTKLLTLSLDNSTRHRIELALAVKSGDLDSTAKMRFIQAMMSTVNYFKMAQVVPLGTEEESWTILDEECKRDGSLYLQKIRAMNGILAESARMIFAHFSTAK